MPEKWEEIAAGKRAALLSSISKEWLIPANIKPLDSQRDVTGFPKDSGWFTQKELEITSLAAVEILEKLGNREWTAEDVTAAFCKRAAAAHQLVWMGYFTIILDAY
jgi:amidase